jgi:hypothetical protein
MTKNEVKETFYRIRGEYNQIPYPKYLHADLDDLQHKYELLQEMEDVLKDDFTYAKLINSICQTIHRLSRKGTWNNLSERGMNKAIPPVLKRGNQEMVPYEWKSRKSGQMCSITNGYWNARNYMVMDVVGYFFLLKEGGDRLPEVSNPIFANIDSIRKREQELNVNRDNNSDEPLVINEEDLSVIKSRKYLIKFEDHHFRSFTGLNMCSNDILDLLLRTSRVEFKVTFPIRMIKENGRKMVEKWYSMNVFSRPYELGYINKDVRKDGVVQNRIYYIAFDTILGEMFVHNLLTRNYDWVSNSLYNLPQSAQIFYRHFLLHHDYPQTDLNLTTIKEQMNFQDKNITNLISNLEINTLTPLMRNGLILSYKRKDGLNGIKYVITLPKKMDQKKPELLTETKGDVGSGK